MPEPPNTIAHVLTRLQRSPFRTRFTLSARDQRYLSTRAMTTITQHAQHFIQTRLAPAFPHHDGKQTPMRGHPVFTAQHATASCCRGCLAKWHNIPEGRPLSKSEQHFISALIGAWLERQPRQVTTTRKQLELFQTPNSTFNS
nr:DUF4186 domain-containing protein [uncultured Neokomagataea sp.]